MRISLERETFPFRKIPRSLVFPVKFCPGSGILSSLSEHPSRAKLLVLLCLWTMRLNLASFRRSCWTCREQMKKKLSPVCVRAVRSSGEASVSLRGSGWSAAEVVRGGGGARLVCTACTRTGAYGGWPLRPRVGIKDANIYIIYKLT